MPTQKQLQHALREHIVALNPQIMVTFNYQRQVTLDQMRAHIIHFANVAQRQVLGRNWNHRPEDKRLSIIGVAEHLDTNSHVHAAVRGPESLIEFLQGAEAEMLWRRVHARCGQLHAGTEHNPSKIAAYMTKDLYQANSLDRAIFYAPQRSTQDAPCNH